VQGWGRCVTFDCAHDALLLALQQQQPGQRVHELRGVIVLYMRRSRARDVARLQPVECAYLPVLRDGRLNARLRLCNSVTWLETSRNSGGDLACVLSAGLQTEHNHGPVYLRRRFRR
jgi:hypothetical protein